MFLFIPGISVKPVKGSAIYWFNHDHIGENDSRSYHLECPVGFGNKWVATKRVKWTGQVCTKMKCSGLLVASADQNARLCDLIRGL